MSWSKIFKNRYKGYNTRRYIEDSLEISEPIEERKLKLYLSPYRKMYYYTCAAPGEISGLGKVKIIENDIILTDVLLFNQKCSGGFTSLDTEALSQFIVALIKKGENPEDWRLWWHSHNDFSVGWSGTDEQNIQRHSKDSTLISVCINKEGEMVARIDERGHSSDLSTIILPTDDSKIKSKCYEEVKQKVKIDIIKKKKGFIKHEFLTPTGYSGP